MASRRKQSWILVLALAASGAAAQEVEGVHIVRPGDTLRGLASRHLGSEERWLENWRLNPHIEDPDVLVPGQRIRILVPRANPLVPTARIIAVAGQVDERPAPVDWLGAAENDLLLERDALRTRQASSSALLFPDGTQLALTEGSLVFLRRAGRSLEGVDDRAVEIVEGQADLAATTPEVASAEIEILIGNTVATPRAGESGEVQARVRKSEEGGAALMVYEGAGAVEAGGEVVEMSRGTGVAVPSEGPPPPPEKLLDAPLSTAPAPGARLGYPDPEFAWQAVDGAVSYVVEICRDADCLELVRRQTGLKDTRWRAAPLPVATHHWRVTAVSPSGLDGYPSTPSILTVLSDRRDEELPTATFDLEGRSIAAGDSRYWAPSSRVTIEVLDEHTGVDSWRPVIDDRPAQESDLQGPWGDGEHAVDAAVADRAGNQGRRSGVRFVVDAEPPRLVWELATEEVLEPLLAAVDKPERWRKRWRYWRKRADRSIRRHGELATWALVAWSSEAFAPGALAQWSVETLRWRERRSHQTVAHSGISPAMLIAAPRLRPPGLDESEGPVGMLLVRALDDKSGCRSLSLRTVRTEAGPVLEVEAVDRLGNRRSERLPFVAAD